MFLKGVEVLAGKEVDAVFHKLILVNFFGFHEVMQVADDEHAFCDVWKIFCAQVLEVEIECDLGENAVGAFGILV